MSPPSAAQRGAARTAVIVLVGLAVLLLLSGGCQYNALVGSQEQVRAAWSEIDNQYKRRLDLIPNLVETVKGAANFERSTLEAVTQARAAVSRAQLPADLPKDPAQLQAYIQAQQQLGGVLGRLFAVAERYPELKATAAFRDLQVQIEGTENRIAVARRDYIDAARAFNARVRTFPANLFAGLFGFTPVAQFQVDSGERTVPKVDFGQPGK